MTLQEEIWTHGVALHTIGCALVISATAHVILDIEYPRLGLTRVDAADELLRDLRRRMD